MKTFVLAAAAALATTAAPALAADLVTKARPAVVAAPPSAWDIAFGAALTNDYRFRGIAQSNLKPSVSAYFEPRFNINPNLQVYAGIAGNSISFPNRAAAEIDFYGGIRPTLGPVAFDFGIWHYWYPGGREFSATSVDGPIFNGNVAKADFSFTEFYAKAAWTVVEPFVVGVAYNYSPNFLNTGATGNWLSANAKYTFGSFGPGITPYISGELGRQWLGTTDAFYGSIKLPSYTHWNVGVGWSYKVFTVDLRYSDTTLNKGDCNALTADHTATGTTYVTPINGGAGSKWCGAAFVAKLAVDLTLDNIK